MFIRWFTPCGIYNNHYGVMWWRPINCQHLEKKRLHHHLLTHWSLGYLNQLLDEYFLILIFDGLDIHYGDVTIDTIASQITSLTIVYATVYSDADQRKHHSSASLAFVREIRRWPVNPPHKWPVTRKIFPFDDVIMSSEIALGHWSSVMIGQHWFR